MIGTPICSLCVLNAWDKSGQPEYRNPTCVFFSPDWGRQGQLLFDDRMAAASAVAQRLRPRAFRDIRSESARSENIAVTGWVRSTHSSQFDRSTASGKAMCFHVGNRPKESHALGADPQTKWTLNRPWLAAGGSRYTVAKEFACLSSAAGQQSGAEIYNISYNMPYKALAKPSE